MGAIITLILVLPICSGVVFLFLKMLRAQARKAEGQERELIKAEVDKFDASIDAAVKRLKLMESVDELSKFEAQKNEVLQQLEAEKSRVKKLELDLAELQAKVDKQEARHNELKKGKEDCDQIAESTRASLTAVADESVRLAGEVENSKKEVETILGSGVNGEQKTALNGITATLERMGTQLAALVEVYGQSSQRFLNLSTQYQELEKEYRKLIDKELSGETPA